MTTQLTSLGADISHCIYDFRTPYATQGRDLNHRVTYGVLWLQDYLLLRVLTWSFAIITTGPMKEVHPLFSIMWSKHIWFPYDHHCI